MVIDIDSFLNKYNNKDVNTQVVEDDEEKIVQPLEFQKTVEDRIRKTEEEGLQGDFNFLKKVYEEVKKFDEDLPNKFLGIENKGALAIKSLGEKFSQEFLIRIKENANIIEQQITFQLQKLDAALLTNNFQEIVTIYEDCIKRYKHFPREMLSEKLRVSNNIRTREVAIHEKLKNYKEVKLKQIKERLRKVPSELKSMLKPGNGKIIEDGINKLDYLLNTIPKLFMSDLTDERIALSKMLILSEEYLEKEYKRDYEERTHIIDELMDKFHSCYLKNDLDQVLITYDEVLYQFNELPDVFYNKKFDLYKKIIDLYTSINNLIVKDSVHKFLESYNYSKQIEEARDYLIMIKNSGVVSGKKLDILKEKLDKIPEKYKFEKEDLLSEVHTLAEKYSLELNKPKQEAENKEKIQDEFDMDNFIPQKPQKIIRNVPLTDDSYIKQRDLVDKSKLMEIKRIYMQIKQSNNASELRILYKKIMTYINSLHIRPEEKNKFISKINYEINQKHLM